MELFKTRQSSLLALFIFAVVASLVSGCATRPWQLGRKGLLDTDRTRSRSIASGGQEEANERYGLREGEKVILNGNWRWPLKSVHVSSPFGDRGNKFHQGIDLRAPVGTRVMAAADGEAVYVGSKIRGYGRMVVLKHAGNFYTVYAHHSKNAVKLGKKVKMGDTIGYSGRSGHSTGPHLHFEIRRGTQSFDPEYALNEAVNQPMNQSLYTSRSRAVASEDSHLIRHQAQ
jgi:murein DD-endopeptidase MepM/ murein hydrolase activator NlpD